MNTDAITQTEEKWKISKQQEMLFSDDTIVDLLSTLNQIGGQDFYVMDYRREKIIVECPNSPILCGYPKEKLDEEGFGFFKRILSKKEWTWLMKVNKASYSVFFDTPFKSRKKLLFSYELAFITKDNGKSILHHKLLPYQLCENKNMWLSLCSVVKSGQKKSGLASLVNNHTEERYKFIDGRFKEIPNYVLTKQERLILEWMIKGYTAEYMASELKIAIPTLKQKKGLMYKKMGVGTAVEAVHWAHLKKKF